MTMTSGYCDAAAAADDDDNVVYHIFKVVLQISSLSGTLLT